MLFYVFFRDYEHLFRPDNASIVITHILEDNDAILIRRFADLFNILVISDWNDTVTHLIVKTAIDNIYEGFHTHYMNALVYNNLIISIKWVEMCLKTKTLLSEVSIIK